MATEKKKAPRKTPGGGRAGRAEPPSFAFPFVRTRVLEALANETAPPAKLTTLVAPTGYGKTVMATALFQHFRDAGAHGEEDP